MNERLNKFSIELDCAPGGLRPNDLIGSVLHGTGIAIDDFDTGAPFFGHQTWILKETAGKDQQFTDSKPLFKQRIVDMYDSGIIRYGTW